MECIVYCWITLFLFASLSQCKLIKELYCGEKNCYDVLGVSKDDSRANISRAYRRLAYTYHPDRARSKEEIEEFTIKFRQITTAYETLRDDGVREDYNQYLENPNAYYRTYYRYYRRRLTPKVDVRIVIAVFLVVVSGVQMFVQHSSYHQAVNAMLTVPKFRNQAMQIARENGLINSVRKKNRETDKAELKNKQQLILKEIIANNIGSDSIPKPTVRNTIVVQLLLLPYTSLMYLLWWVKWQWNHTLRGLPYDRDEKLYLIRRFMKLDERRFRLQYEDSFDTLLDDELWKWDRFQNWAKTQEEERERRLMQSGRYKSYQRWLRSGGGNHITFDPD